MIKLLMIGVALYLVWWSAIIYTNHICRAILDETPMPIVAMIASMLLPLVAAVTLYFGVV